MQCLCLIYPVLLRGSLNLTSTKEMLHKALSHHHLPAAQHAAPATVCCHLGTADGSELSSVGKPQATGEVGMELVQC